MQVALHSLDNKCSEVVEGFSKLREVDEWLIEPREVVEGLSELTIVTDGQSYI